MNAKQPIEAAETVPSVLNNALLDQYRARKSNLLSRLITAYLQEAPNFIQNIRKAEVSMNFDELRANSHALKSCSYNLGAMRLSKACQELEGAAGARDTALVQAVLARFGPECFEAEQALRSELYKLNRSTMDAQLAATNTEDSIQDWN